MDLATDADPVRLPRETPLAELLERAEQDARRCFERYHRVRSAEGIAAAETQMRLADKWLLQLQLVATHLDTMLLRAYA